MILSSSEEQKKEAFRLFEDGRYLESLVICNRLLEAGKDPALEVLAATNLYYTGRYEDAEVFFRDLAIRMPGSSYVHSYLAKALEARGDEGAVAEYATAVHLDSNNLDAVRSYADYLIVRKDFHGALPVLRHLIHQGKKPEDLRKLMRALIEIGEADEALEIHSRYGDAGCHSPEYVRALVHARKYQDAALSAFSAWQKKKDPAMLRTYLDALSRYDLQGSFAAYASHLQDNVDCEILYDYALLLHSSGETAKALEVVRDLCSLCPAEPSYRLVECDLLADAGDTVAAREHYEGIIRDELASRNDPEMLDKVLLKYRYFLEGNFPADEAERRFLDTVSHDLHVVSLLATARFFEDRNNPSEARSWYYRAYRADFLAGGPEYALFLAKTGEGRECEKVMLYVLSNIRKGADLVKVGSIIVREGGRMRTMRRLMDQLIRKLENRRATLSSEGLEMLAIAFFLAASHAQEAGDFSGCKYLCLSGMDVIPAHSRTIRLDDYLTLLRCCKEQALADRPVMQDRKEQDAPDVSHPEESVADQLGLSEQEQKILSFLRLHRKTNEMELRTLLGSRRVVGIVNRLIQKAASQGISLIEKKGMGKEGEIYEYTGS